MKHEEIVVMMAMLALQRCYTNTVMLRTVPPDTVSKVQKSLRASTGEEGNWNMQITN